MRLTPIIGALACLGLASAAAAADFGGSLKDDYSAPAGHNWTGLYIGGNFGWANGDYANQEPSGWAGGAQIGYNLQLGQIVIGAEADYQWSDMDGRVQDLIIGESDIDSFASVRARLGLAIDRAMPYVTAGYGWADVDARILGLGEDSNTHDGWVYGGGVEFALRPDLSIRGEYLHYDLGSEDYTFGGVGPLPADLDFQTIRVGASYRFGP